MTPQQPLTLTAKEKPMNPYLLDFVLLAGLAVGYIVFFVASAVVVTRIGIGVHNFLNRNAR